MKLRVKDLNIASGGVLVAVFNHKDAVELGIHYGDRIGLKKDRKHVHVIVDLAENGKVVSQGSVGLFEEALKALGARQGSVVNLALEEKPLSVKYIKQKLNGEKLKEGEISEIVDDLVTGRISDVELTYFVSASYVHGLDEKETVALTKAMIKTGDKLNFPPRQIVLDKHSIGGVPGNRTTPIIVPIIAAAGLTIPKTSSRAITSAAGTADTMEVLAPVEFAIDKMKSIVRKTGGCIVWGGAINLAPADDKIIQVEHPLGIDPEGQLLASILAKKGSVGATHVLIEIPLGVESKVKTKAEAMRLEKKFKSMGKELGMHIEVFLSNGNEPVGNGIGPALEAKDVLKVLQRSDTRPMDLERKAVAMAGRMLELACKCKKRQGKQMALQLLDSGKALRKFKQILKAQGGNPDVSSGDIPVGQYCCDYNASRSGIVKDIDNRVIARVAKFAGAPLDKGAGVYLYVHEGEKVKKGERILTVHAENRKKLEFAKEILYKGRAVTIG